MKQLFTRSVSAAAICAALLLLTQSSCKRSAHPIEDGLRPMITTTSSPSLDANGNTAAAHLNSSESLDIPAAVDLPEGSKRVATYYAVGVQKYKARVKLGSYPQTLEWVFVAPEADLYDSNNNKVGSHGAGPFWKLLSGDSIVAMHFLPTRTAPSLDPQSIDWLLLQPKTGVAPSGIFAGVDFIQRIATKGGKTPLTPPLSLDDVVNVKYKAVYRFSSAD